MEQTAIYAEHIHKTYSGGFKAVEDLSFSVRKGSCFGFLGPNGAGKTTLMKTLFGMARRDPRPETKVSVLGFDPAVDELSIKHLSGVVPQDDNLDAEVNVSQNLLIFSKFYGMGAKEAKARIAELLEFMELSEKAKSPIKDLSGGMKRRLIIARALLNKPSLLILDEPTTGLDPQVRQMIWDKIRGLKREGVTVLLTTHYMDEAYQIADRIIIMDHGKRVLEGVPRQLMQDGMEPYVLEITDKTRLPMLQGEAARQFRLEETAERAHFYGSDLERLQALSSGFEPGSFFLRPTNLEDLFLRSTGRQLNDEQ
jgi:lipooligosaccharide transport system ATP-binding protein